MPAATDAPAHVHRWVIATPAGPTSPGRCRCGQVRHFPNVPTWDPDRKLRNSPGKPGRRGVCSQCGEGSNSRYHKERCMNPDPATIEKEKDDMANFATCSNCRELFEVRDDSDFRHTEMATGGVRTSRDINLCPACAVAARGRGQPPAPESPPLAEASESPPATEGSEGEQPDQS